MLGFVLTLLLCALATLAASGWWIRHSDDPAEAWGAAGLTGLGLAGLATLFVGLLPNGLRWGWMVILAFAMFLAYKSVREGVLSSLRFRTPRSVDGAFPVVLGVMMLLALVAVLTPSVTDDWDSLAYHLAVPKIWLQSGQIHYVPALHQSNFPFTVDNLYIWGLSYGGQSAAKAFNWAVLLLGCFALFGLTRRWYGGRAGWWACVGFVGMPVVLWEAGTAYVDLAHGIFAGLGLLYLCEPVQGKSRRWWPAALMLGLAIGSKYTGLQVMLAGFLAAGVVSLRLKTIRVELKPAFLALVLAVSIGGAWYVKNAIQTGNPVYPYLYKTLGGREWDEWRDATYRNEQQTFGVGRTERGRDPSAIGHAIFGLAYQPGRYVNPGQEQGYGAPTGSIGFAALLGACLFALSGLAKVRERTVLLSLGLLFLLWYFLSQQSRYLTIAGVPMVVLAAGFAVRAGFGRVVAFALSFQALYTGWLVATTQTASKLPVLLGEVSREEYQRRQIGFFDGAEQINRLSEPVKVALYDEVFGFLLDKPYMWANPGHSTIIPYDNMRSGADWESAMRRLGFTHAYVNLGAQPPDQARAWAAELGLVEGPGWEPSQREEMWKDLGRKWMILIAQAVRSGDAKVVWAGRRSVLLEL